MSHPDDWAEFRRCIRLSREIIAQQPMDPIGRRNPARRGRRVRRGDRCLYPRQCRKLPTTHVNGAHGAGCGDERCRSTMPGDWCGRVTVADSSIFPRITNGNLNAPSIMTGEKAADHIMGRAPLARANDLPFFHPEADRLQR